MWENLYYQRNRGVHYRNREAYNELFGAYEHARRSGASDQATVDAMTRVIERQVSEGDYISLHLMGEAVDVRSRSMTALQREAFEQTVQRVLGHSALVETGHYHVQF